MADDASLGELAGYRPVSGLAVAALVAGCGSALVLFTPLAAVLPLVAGVLALVALADLRRSEGRRVGRVAALAGLALAIGFTAQAIAGGMVDHWIAGRRARATALAWIDAVREERFTDAIGLCSPAALPATGRDPFTPAPDEAERQTSFVAMPAVAALAACGEARPTVTSSRSSTGEAAWLVRVNLAACPAGSGALQVEVAARPATRGRTPVERWLVTGFALEP
jgi:hypothetical protein